MTEVSKQIALVTGATRGIGAAIAQALAAGGMTVIGTATGSEGAQKISAALTTWPGCRGAVLDVRDAAAGDALVEAIVKEHGALHVLVNNAGITRDTLAMRMKDEDWNAVLETNLTAVFRMSRAVMRPMMKQRYGRIVNITSVVGATGNPGQANYAAAKAGVAGMTRALARELASRGVTVNCVAPGFIATDMTASGISSSLLLSLRVAWQPFLFSLFFAPPRSGRFPGRFLPGLVFRGRLLQSAPHAKRPFFPHRPFSAGWPLRRQTGRAAARDERIWLHAAPRASGADVVHRPLGHRLCRIRPATR